MRVSIYLHAKVSDFLYIDSRESTSSKLNQSFIARVLLGKQESAALNYTTLGQDLTEKAQFPFTFRYKISGDAFNGHSSKGLISTHKNSNTSKGIWRKWCETLARFKVDLIERTTNSKRRIQ
jgi:hypothetical protein